jgi:serine-type D-Ala-D-Ala carboxypeptidase
MTLGKLMAASIAGVRTTDSKGLRNESLPVSAHTASDLGSVTKLVATTSILLKLVESGTVSLDDKVSKYLSEWTSYPRATTLRDLLEHQSGLTEWRPLYISQRTEYSARQVIASEGFKYTSGRHYSDLGFITLGNVIMQVLATDLESAFKEWISHPLKLSATQFALPVDPGDVFASSFGDQAELKMLRTQMPYETVERAGNFSRWRTHVLDGEINDGNSFHLYQGVSGHAGLFSTAGDLLTFGEELLSSLAGNGYFRKDILESFLTPGQDPMQGLGFRSWEHDGHIEYWGHTGFPGITFAISPSNQSVVVLFSNRLLTKGVPENTEDIFGQTRIMMRNSYRR